MLNNSPNEPLTQALYISRLDVKLSEQSRKLLKAIKLQVHNRTLKDFQATISPGGIHSEIFLPAIEFQLGESFSVSPQYLGRIRARHKEMKITMNHHEALSGVREKRGLQTYQKTQRKIDVIISFYLMRPTTDEIIESCPRFRLLIIGNSGVGKSSLIKEIFGVQEVHVSEDQRGEANIDTEFVSSQNGRFVLHDTKGFEEGDANNIGIVQQFVERRKNQRWIKDRLHAVWLCLEVPYSGGRLLESGIEDFLRRRHEVLGDVPLVIVMTKVDLLENQLEMDIQDNPNGKSFEQLKSDFLKEHCIEPLRAAAEDVPHAIVSTQHPTMFTEVVKVTTDHVKTHIGEEPAMLAAMAQRSNIKVNIESSIAIGRKKYWSMLAKSAAFSGHTLEECVRVLHKDIVTVWNFYDPEEVLQQEDFIGALIHTGDVGQQEAPAPQSQIPISSMAFDAAKAVIGVSPEPHLILIVSIVGAAIWLAKLAHDVYQQSKRVVKLFMLYIVGAMFVMQAIFLLAPEGRVTRKVVEGAINAYLLSKRQRVRERIDGFVDGLLPGGPDYVLSELENVIKSCRIRDDEVEELRNTIQVELAKAKEGKEVA